MITGKKISCFSKKKFYVFNDRGKTGDKTKKTRVRLVILNLLHAGGMFTHDKMLLLRLCLRLCYSTSAKEL